MKLTEQQIEDLKSLKQHPWYLQLKKLEDEFMSEYNKKIMLAPDFDPESLETQKKMKEASMYLKARQWVFREVEKATMEIAWHN